MGREQQLPTGASRPENQGRSGERIVRWKAIPTKLKQYHRNVRNSEDVPMSAFDPLRTSEHPDRLFWMRTSLFLLTASALACCGRAESPENEQQRLERQYKAWAARQPRPPAPLVDRIEALLAKEPCVGSMDRWSRYYGYNHLPEKTVDTGIVDFHLEEAGTPGVRPGRHITEPDSWVNIDDRPIKMVSGDYDVEEDRIRIAFCGDNFGGPGTGGIDNMNSYFDELKQRRSAHAK